MKPDWKPGVWWSGAFWWWNANVCRSDPFDFTHYSTALA